MADDESFGDQVNSDVALLALRGALGKVKGDDVVAVEEAGFLGGDEALHVDSAKRGVFHWNLEFELALVAGEHGVVFGRDEGAHDRGIGDFVEDTAADDGKQWLLRSRTLGHGWGWSVLAGEEREDEKAQAQDGEVRLGSAAGHGVLVASEIRVC